jgi:hypothetical protein
MSPSALGVEELTAPGALPVPIIVWQQRWLFGLVHYHFDDWQ